MILRIHSGDSLFVAYIWFRADDERGILGNKSMFGENFDDFACLLLSARSAHVLFILNI